MAKKKLEYNAEDPETWSDAQMNKYIIDSVKDIGLNMPWDKIALSAVFIFAHWKAFGAGPMPTVGDVMLGIMYALTIPPALQGGLVANGYAVGLLSVLGVGLVGGDVKGKMDELGDNLPSVVSSNTPRKFHLI